MAQQMAAETAALDQVPEEKASVPQAPAHEEPATLEKPWKGKYPNPWVDDYLAEHPLAIGINTFGDTQGPASQMRLGESWAATIDYYMHDSPEVHPAVLATGTSVAFAVIAIVQRTHIPENKTRESPPPAKEPEPEAPVPGGDTDAPSYP